MRKLHIVIIIIVASILALGVQVLFGNYLSARLATLPGLRNLDLFDPRAPIVVTNRETVRVSDSNDAIETTNAVKSKISTIVYYEGTGATAQLVVSGGAVNWTSDGYFVTTAAALSVPNKTYAVILNNGDIFPIKDVYADTASNLVIVSTDARNLPTIEPVNAVDLRPGEKMLMVINSVGANKTSFLESYVKNFSNDVTGIVFDSDIASRAIFVQSVGTLTAGHVAVNLDGRLAGLWDGTNVVSADVIRIFANNYFRDNMQIIRPGYGFTYKQLLGSEARALQLPFGAQVLSVGVGSAAATAQLQVGDIITAVNGKKIDDDNLLEASLAGAIPGDIVTLAVTRNGQLTTVVVTPTILE